MPEKCGQEWQQFSLSQNGVGLYQVVQPQLRTMFVILKAVRLLKAYKQGHVAMFSHRIVLESFLSLVRLRLLLHCGGFTELHSSVRRAPRYVEEGC